MKTQDKDDAEDDATDQLNILSWLNIDGPQVTAHQHQ